MILINSIIKVEQDVAARIQLRNQLNAAGMQARVLGKLEALDYRRLNIQIETYKVQADNDFEDCFGEEQSLYGNIEEPVELLSLILANLVDAPEAVTHLVATLRGMLLIKGEQSIK
jgi:Diaphanous FH3 Domain